MWLTNMRSSAGYCVAVWSIGRRFSNCGLTRYAAVQLTWSGSSNALPDNLYRILHRIDTSTIHGVCTLGTDEWNVCGSQAAWRRPHHNECDLNSSCLVKSLPGRIITQVVCDQLKDTAMNETIAFGFYGERLPIDS